MAKAVDPTEFQQPQVTLQRAVSIGGGHWL